MWSFAKAAYLDNPLPSTFKEHLFVHLSEDVDQTNSGMELTISDNGVGIAPSNLPKVFDAFFTTRDMFGTGIGLFIAKQFLESHGGEIGITSQTDARSHGTTVRVFLPVKTTYEASPNA